MREDDNTKRFANRIPDHHTIRVKKVSSVDAKWDVSTIRNISRTGVLFYSSSSYEPGSEVKIRIMNPIIVGEIDCYAKVVRCYPLTEVKGMYGVALEFAQMQPEDKEAMEKTIELFIQKKKKQEES